MASLRRKALRGLVPACMLVALLAAPLAGTVQARHGHGGHGGHGRHHGGYRSGSQTFFLKEQQRQQR